MNVDQQAMTLHGMEKQRRELLWNGIGSTSTEHTVQTHILTDLGIYGGGRGIWTNKAVTSALDPIYGVTVSVLHTGRHYPDDLSDKYLVYHYPQTAQEGKDDQEIRATKNACRLQLPIFVISVPDGNPRLRSVRRGYVLSWDDSARTFLIQFDEGVELLSPLSEIAEEAPFELKDETEATYARTKTRPNQPKFNFEVFKRYGTKCAVCDVRVPALLQAAHICSKSEQGSDDPRNGIVLCANHHQAFDKFLFAIEPSTLAVVTKSSGPSASDLMITRNNISHLAKRPHQAALEWHHKQFVRK